MDILAPGFVMGWGFIGPQRHHLSAVLEHLKILAVSPLAGLLLDLGLDPLGHLLLLWASVHPVRFVITRVAGDLERLAAGTDGASLVALLATEPAGVAAIIGPHLAADEMAEHFFGDVTQAQMPALNRYVMNGIDVWMKRVEFGGYRRNRGRQEYVSKR